MTTKRARKPRLVPAVAIPAPREPAPQPRAAPRRPASALDLTAALYGCAAVMLTAPMLIGIGFLKGWSV